MMHVDPRAPGGSIETRAQAWARVILIPLAIVLGIAGSASLLAAFTPASEIASPPTGSAGSDLTALVAALASPQPIVVTFPDQMMVVTPSPIPPTPTPPMATPIGLDICTDLTRPGTVCKQPKPPLPPPTEVPDCPTTVGKNCVKQAGRVTWLPTPTPIVTTYPQ